MSEMVERLARRLCAFHGYTPDEPAQVRYGPHKGLCWEMFVPEARVAIEELRPELASTWWDRVVVGKPARAEAPAE